MITNYLKLKRCPDILPLFHLKKEFGPFITSCKHSSTKKVNTTPHSQSHTWRHPSEASLLSLVGPQKVCNILICMSVRCPCVSGNVGVFMCSYMLALSRQNIINPTFAANIFCGLWQRQNPPYPALSKKKKQKKRGSRLKNLGNPLSLLGLYLEKEVLETLAQFLISLGHLLQKFPLPFALVFVSVSLASVAGKIKVATRTS